MTACAPASRTLLNIHGSLAGILTMGETPDEAIAPMDWYIALSSMLPCSQSTRIHYERK